MGDRECDDCGKTISLEDGHEWPDDGYPILCWSCQHGRLSAANQFIIAADSELSAIAHGRPPSDKEELLRISGGLRKCYEKKRN